MAPAERASLLEAWILAGDAEPVPAAARARAWAALERQISTDRPSASPAPLRPAVRRSLRLVPVFRYAAAAVLVALLAVPFVLDRQGIEYRTPDGVASTLVQLPDGSEVELGAGSTLEVSRTFGEATRSVRLDGEAFFDVSRQDMPFVVETFSARVEVLGTAFNVRARQDDVQAVTAVNLERGSVRVVSPDVPQVAVRLRPGESTIVAPEAVPTAPVTGDANAASAWRSGGLAFSNAPISNVLDEIERRYGVRIDAPDDIRLARVSLFRHSATTAEELLGDLADTAGLRFRRTAQGYEIFVP